ncbi:MAG: ATP-binding protein [Candidatus Muiribacteriota bacterium]
MTTPVIKTKECTGCGNCVTVCPVSPKVFEIMEEKSKVVHAENCIDCGACIANCPVKCIKMK